MEAEAIFFFDARKPLTMSKYGHRRPGFFNYMVSPNSVITQRSPVE